MKKRRWLAVLLTASVAMGLCAGCGGGNTTETTKAAENGKTTETAVTEADKQEAKKETVTIRVWGGVPEEAGPQESIDLFNEQYKDKGIQAEYVRYVNDDNGNLKLETTLLSGEGADVYMSYNPRQMSKRIEGGMALDLTELCQRDGFDIDKDFGTLAGSYKFDGKYYGVPTKVDQYGIMINKNMFDEAGIPIPEKWTYSEFRDIAAKLTKGEGDDKTYGMFFNTQQNLMVISEYFGIQALGGNWMYNEDGTATNFDNPVTKQSIQLLYDMMNVDKSAPTHTDSVTQKLTQEGMFLSGKSAMTIGPWIIRSVKNTESYPHDFVTAFAPYPVPDGVESIYNQGGAGDIVCINPKSEHVEEAWEYVKWYSTGGMIPLAKGGRVPLYNKTDTESVVNAFMDGAENLLDRDTTKNVLIDLRENHAVTTMTTKSSELGQIYKEEAEAVLNDQKTVEEGVASMKERGDATLKDN